MEWFSNFWSTNFDSILISLAIGFVFFVLGPIGVWFSGRKIRRERISQAKEMLIDLIEGMIVNQEEITNIKLKKVFNAVEREVNVSIDAAYDLERLFEDVMLRFQRSKHLDAAQKDTYSKKLSELSTALESESEESARIIPRAYEKIISDLELSTSGNTDAEKVIDELKQKLDRMSPSSDPVLNIFRIYSRIAREKPALFYTVSVFVVAFYAVLIYEFEFK